MELEIIPIDDDKWDDIVGSFTDSDIYYHRGYVKAFQIHGDGDPLLFYAHSPKNRGICVMMKRDVATDERFKGKIEPGKYFDMVTPYGYGGFIFDHKPSGQEILLLKDIMESWLKGQGIISAFFRFHPVLDNADCSRNLLEVIDLGHTVMIDTTSPEVIWQNIISKNRNMIRKAEKSGVEIKHCKDPALFGKFMEIYNATMEHDDAEEYYFFESEFYDSIAKDLRDNYEMFYAEHDGEIIAMSIMIFANGRMHYHLSGSKFEYRNLAPSNLLLYKAALWGNGQGFKSFHLGGGVGSGEDNLYKFKAAFNRNSDCRFSIGKWLIDSEKYDYLTSLRNDDGFDKDSKYFPLYRS